MLKFLACCGKRIPWVVGLALMNIRRDICVTPMEVVEKFMSNPSRRVI